MDNELKRKERELERLSVEEEIGSKKQSIAEKKALEKAAKKKYGRNWKKVLGVATSIKPNQEVIQDLYSMGGGSDLRDLNDPSKGFGRGRSRYR